MISEFNEKMGVKTPILGDFSGSKSQLYYV